jgi:hypothetical protein
MTETNVAMPLKRFLLIEQCPAAWAEMDLYLFRDEAVAFYAGQSQRAFTRVWDHLLSGFHGHSIVGRFVWANWPQSMRFTIELLNSHSGEFNDVGNDLNAAESRLIRQWSPCFNVSLNAQPNSVPEAYRPVNARLRCSRSLRSLIYQAEKAVRAEQAGQWTPD